MFDCADTLADTKAKRHALLGLYCSLWLFWQIVWNTMIFWQVSQAKDYDGLFLLMQKLSGWTSCFLVRLLLYGIQIMSSGMAGFWTGLGSCFHAADVLFVIAGVLYLSGLERKTGGLLIGIEFSLLILCILTAAVFGLSASSIMEVVSILKAAAYGCLGINLLLLVSTLILFVRQISTLVNALSEEDEKI